MEEAEDRLLSTEQVAGRVGVSVETVRRWIRGHKVQGVDRRAGKPRLRASNVGTMRQPDWRVDPADLRDFLRRRADA